MMIRGLEVLNYKSLRYAGVSLDTFHVLVGPNASGKSAFLDALSFLHDFLTEGLEIAVKKRTDNFLDLVWGRGTLGNRFELAVEMDISDSENPADHKILRYETAFQYNKKINEIQNPIEQVYLTSAEFKQATILSEIPPTLIHPLIPSQTSWMKSLENDGREKYVNNTNTIYLLGRGSLLNSSNPSEFSHWVACLREILYFKYNFLYLNPVLMKKACPSASGKNMISDGSNLPWVIDDFKKKHPQVFWEWLSHLRTALPDLEDINVFVRPEDRHCFLIISYKNGLQLPSWAVSDGTLRLLALTLPVYLPDTGGIYLIEEPENGIHPQAIQTVVDSFKSFYQGQVLVTTHSPLIMSLVEPQDILCFTQHSEKGTRIIPGNDHPVLKEWLKNKETSLGVLFASGILDSEWGDDEGPGDGCVG